jgi:hypothetical protein
MSTKEIKKTIKWPRVAVSHARHAKLLAESKKRNISMEAVAEEKFKAAK